MTDPLSAVSAVASLAKAVEPEAKASAALSASLWGNLLGPPSQALGKHFGQQVERWSENQQARKVLQLAAQKTDSTIHGSVPPRVAAAVLESSQYTDDEFVAEYLSGVLASARTPDGKDDRGVSWSALVNRLSADSLRLHYIIYSIMRRKMRGANVDVMAVWCRKYIVVQYIELLPHLGFGETIQAMRRVLDALYALQREGLLEHLTHGSASHLTGFPYGQYVLPDAGDMIIVSTTIQGVQFFLQGHGYGDVWADAIAESNRNFEVVGEIEHELSNISGTWLEDLPKKEA